MSGRAPLWVGLGLISAGLVALAIGSVIGPTGPAYPGAATPLGPGATMGAGQLARRWSLARRASSQAPPPRRA